MNMQDVFDRIVERSKNRVRSRESWLCRYRHSVLPPCFIGALIKDEFYDPKMEGHGIMARVVRHAVEKSLGMKLTPRGLDLLRDCQIIHDSTSTKNWDDGLKNIARKYGLMYNGQEPT